MSLESAEKCECAAEISSVGTFSAPALPTEGEREICGVVERRRETVGCKKGLFVLDGDSEPEPEAVGGERKPFGETGEPEPEWSDDTSCLYIIGTVSSLPDISESQYSQPLRHP